MAVYTVLLPPPGKRTGHEAPVENAVFVRDGFSWLALFFPVLWLLFNRLWLLTILYIAIAVGLEIAASVIGGPVPGVLSVAFTVLFAFEANALKRWALVQRGYAFAGIVSGRGRIECERRFFQSWLADGTPAPARQPAVARPHRPVSSSAGLGEPGILGLFPDKGATS